MSNHRPQELSIPIPSQSETMSSHSCVKCAEVAGGTAAECAVICCCVPCGILNLAILALFTVPTGICKKIFRKKRRSLHQQNQNKLLKKGEVGVGVRRNAPCVNGCEADRQVYPAVTEDSDEVERLEEEMWDTFRSTGFWRSPSQIHRP